MTVTVYLQTKNLLQDLDTIDIILMKDKRHDILKLKDFLDEIKVYKNYIEGSVAINVTLEELNKIDLFNPIIDQYLF